MYNLNNRKVVCVKNELKKKYLVHLLNVSKIEIQGIAIVKKIERLKVKNPYHLKASIVRIVIGILSQMDPLSKS